MINKIVNKSVSSPLLMIVLGLIVVGAGIYSYRQLPVDAFPDVSPNLVQVFTETEGLAPEEIEKYVTYLNRGRHERAARAGDGSFRIQLRAFGCQHIL